MKKRAKLAIFLGVAFGGYLIWNENHSDGYLFDPQRDESIVSIVPIEEKKADQKTNTSEVIEQLNPVCLFLNGLSTQGPELTLFLQELKKENPEVAFYPQLINYEITLPNGEIRRLQIIEEFSTPTGPKRALKFFRLDQELLPVEIQIPEPDRINPSEATIQSYIKRGKLNFKKISGWFKTGESQSLWTQVKDGKIVDIEGRGNLKHQFCQ